MNKIYLETSVISYYIAERSENIIIAGHQISTIKMWRKLFNFDVFISDLVVEEASKGDTLQAEKRLMAIKNFHVLEIDEGTKELAKILISQNAVPTKCPEDALHISVATTNDLDIILTWNFRHINNPFVKKKIQQAIENSGYHFPIICSPEEFLGDNDE